MHTTRERILAHLKRSPGASVETLAREIDLASMTIRQHLTKMVGEGLVRAEAERRPTSRPAYVYSLTSAGEEQFPKAYDRLAAALLDEVSTLDPQDLVGLSSKERRVTLYERAARRAAEVHRSSLDQMEGAERIEAAAAILAGESGFAELERNGADLQIREYNCVFQRVASEHADICTFHTEYIHQLVGTPVALESCQCDGASACTFRIE